MKQTISNKGIIVNVYRCAEYIAQGHDTTNGGVSSKHDCFVLLMNDKESQIFDPTEKIPALVLRKTCYGTLFATLPHDGKMYAHGGNYIKSCDSRFPCAYPIPIHDREITDDDTRSL